ncbi:hypothetical protein R2F25_01755 [Streptomyces sp. UP1A-1]|nr:hypothetical protein [Streptomyces sp. UP1A-1]
MSVPGLRDAAARCGAVGQDVALDEDDVGELGERGGGEQTGRA